MTLTQLALGTALAVAFAAGGYFLGRHHGSQRREPARTVMTQLQKRVSTLQHELALERMKVVACGLAVSNPRHVHLTSRHALWSPSYEDICRLVDTTKTRRDRSNQFDWADHGRPH